MVRAGAGAAVAVALLGGAASAAEIHVSPGKAGGDGSPAKPFGTLLEARDAARRTIERAKEDVHVVLHAGRHVLSETLVLESADGGRDGVSVVWRAAQGEAAEISGGLELPWRVIGADEWRATLPAGVQEPESLRIGATLATPARFPQGDRLDNKAYIAVTGAATTSPATGKVAWNRSAGGWSITLKGDTSAIPTDEPVRLAVRKIWSTCRATATSFDRATGQLKLGDAFSTGTHANLLGAAKDFRCWFEAHPSFARLPGQWAFDTSTREVIYRPAPGQAPDRAPLIVPRVATLLRVKGTAAAPVKRLRFEGITFRDTLNTLDPMGVDDLQACRTDRDWRAHATDAAAPDIATLPVAVLATGMQDGAFESCRFVDLSAHGVAITGGSARVAVRRCTFERIGAVPVIVGSPSNGAAGLVDAATVERNTISRGGLVHGGAPGIWVGITTRTQVTHNHVRHMPYTGISLGWSWNPKPTGAKDNVIANNLIEHVMEFLTDGAGIYCLGDQPNGQMRDNLVRDMPPNTLAGAGYSRNGLYLDEGSQGWTLAGNVVIRVPECSLNFHKPATEPANRVEGNSFVEWKGMLARLTPPYVRSIKLNNAGDGAPRVAFGTNVTLTPADIPAVEAAMLKKVGPDAP